MRLSPSKAIDFITEDCAFLLPALLKLYFDTSSVTPLKLIGKSPDWKKPYILPFAV